MLLENEAVGLIVLSLALAGPVPVALAGARWPARSPRAALVLWQAIGLGGGLGILTAGLTLADARLDRRWLPGMLAVPSHWSRLGPLGWIGVGLTVGVGMWLVGAAVESTTRVLLARRAHRRRLDLVAESTCVDATGSHGGSVKVRLVDYPRAVAYCLPGLRPRVVLSRRAVGTLTPGELTAVLAHERAHARGHHDLVKQPFVAWARTFPFLPSAALAVGAVDRLVEILADDAALRTCSPEDLQGALHRLADDQAATSGSADPHLQRRVAVRSDRLDGSLRVLRRSVTSMIYVAAAALVLAPPVILLLS